MGDRAAVVPGGRPAILAMYDSPADLGLAFSAEGGLVRQGPRAATETYVARWNALFPESPLRLLTFAASFDKAQLVAELNRALREPGYLAALEQRLAQNAESEERPRGP